MNMLNRAYIDAVLPWFEPERNNGLRGRLRRLQSAEKLPMATLLEQQEQALLRLLQYAHRETSFYRARFSDVGFNPESSDARHKLSQVPPLTREDIKTNLESMCSTSYSKAELRPSATGGTTDTPVLFYRDVESLREKTAAQVHFDSWAGYLPGDKVFYLWGARSDYAENPSWRWRLYDHNLMRRVWAPTSLLNEAVLESHRQLLNRFKPAVMYAYPTPLALFCEYLRDSGRSYHVPRSVICTAEALLPEQRELMQQVLGCEVFEHYGSREFGMIASECARHSGLHLNPLAAYLEYLPIKGGEEEGLHEVLVTDLLNHGMPLIRYRVNDCTAPGDPQCPCGRGFPLIQPIVGRWSDIIQLADGSKVPGISLTNRILQVCPGLRKIQVVQETMSEFRLRFVPAPGFSPADLQMVKGNIQKFFPGTVHWKFDAVADIERERSGKTRFCISHVGRTQPPERATV